MSRIQHIFHPIHTALHVYQRMRIAGQRYRAKQGFVNILRGRQDNCWCGGSLISFPWNSGYGICSECGCYVNLLPPIQDELRRFYSFESYWHNRMLSLGYPTIEEREDNDRRDGRLDYWLQLVKCYGPSSGRVIEVGCAHGVLLSELSGLGYDCIGNEPDEQTAQWTRANIGLDVRSGFFPFIELPRCDLFLAFDVIEHSPVPEEFMRKVYELLNDNGIAIIQTPIDRYDFMPPFNGKFKEAFNDIEHLFLFTDKAMEKLASLTGLTVICASERLWLHHEICIFYKPPEQRY